MYLRTCNEKPKLITDTALENTFNGNDRSVYRNFFSISKFFSVSNLNTAMVDLLICWRNKLVHYKADNNIKNESRIILKENKGIILEKHNGLDIENTLKSFDKKGEIPTFKEITSLIKATIDFVYEIDKKLIERIDVIKYADTILLQHIKENKIKRLDSIFSKPKIKEKRVLKTF